ncbi:MAG: ABC transporter permease [Terriglobales bacterium]
MKLLTVIQRELLTRVRTKGFLIITFGLPLLIAGFGFFEYSIFSATQQVASKVAVVDLSQQVLPTLQGVVARANRKDSHVEIEPVAVTPATLPSVEQQLRAQVLAKKIDGYVIIPAGVLTSRTAQFHARNTVAVAASVLSDDLGKAVNQVGLEQAGVPASKIESVTGSFHLSDLKVTATGEHSNNTVTIGIAIGLVAVLYMYLLVYGMVTMRAVTEEKTTRVSEVLLACVDPFSLMLGKILGVALTGLAQFVVWGICLALFGIYGVAMADASGLHLAPYIPHNALWLGICFLLFFFLGYLLYASIYAAFGSMVSSDQEAQQLQIPLTMLLVAALYLAFLVMVNPGSTLSVVLSLIPFFAPVLMVMRVAVSTPPVWQVLLSLVLVLATFLGCTKITAKIYRVGILMTGKRPTLAELLRWLKYT